MIQPLPCIFRLCDYMIHLLRYVLYLCHNTMAFLSLSLIAQYVNCLILFDHVINIAIHLEFA